MWLFAVIAASLWPATSQASVTYPQRESTSLCGQWRYTPLQVCAPAGAADNCLAADFSDANHPLAPVALEPASPTQAVTVPQPGAEPRAPFGLLERALPTPHLPAGSRAVLRFGGVGFACEVLVDGRRAGVHWGPFSEFELDVTDLLPPTGAAVLRLVYASQEIALRPRTPAETYPGGPPLDVPVLLHPRGKTGDIRGIWRPVTLEIRPATHFAELAAETRLAGPRLTVAGDIAGATRGLSVAATLGGPGSTTWRLGTAPVLAGQFRLSGPCPGAAPWSPASPRLYRLSLALMRDGRTVDAATFPVGFREVRVRGADILLNGEPVHLYGTSVTDLHQTEDQVRRQLTWFRGMNMNAVRYHGQPHPEFYLDAADELGMLVVDESDLFGTCDAASYPYEDATFSRAVEGDFREWITRHRLHPSVILWSMENETAAAWPYSERGPLVRWLASLARLARRYDRTRPLEFESDGDPRGSADIACAHYPGEGYCATGVHGQLRLATAEKPFMVGEFSCIDDSKAAASRWVGDEAYYRPSAQSEAVGVYLRATIEGWRRARLDGILPFQWNYAEARWAPPSAGTAATEAPLAAEFRRLFAPVLISLTDDGPVREFGDAGPLVSTVTHGRNYASGEMIRKTVHLCSDLHAPLRRHARWALAEGGGAVVASGSLPVACPADANSAVPLTLSAPAVNATTDYALTVSLLGLAQTTIPVTVYPSALLAPPRLPEPVGLYDVSGETLTVLQTAGVAVHPLHDFSPPLPRLVIVGRESVDATVRGAAGLLRRHVIDGGTVLVFEQRDLSGLGLPVELTPLGEQRAFIAPHAPGHPVFAGLTGFALGPWRGYPAALRSSYAKPATGRLRVLAGASGDRWVGSPTLALLEAPLGRGRYVLCQAELIGHYGREPQATLLAHNLLRWAATAPPNAAPATCDVVFGTAPDFTTAFTRATGRPLPGAGLQGLVPERGDVAVVLARQGVAGLASQREKLAAFAEAGGTVLCLGANASTWDPSWLPAPAYTGDASESRYVLPVREGASPAGASLLWGLPASDLSAGDVWDDPRRAHDPFTSWDPAWEALAWAGAPWTGGRWADFMAPPDLRRAAILRLPHGKGCYLLVQAAILPEVQSYFPWSRASRERQFSTFLTNLNLAADPPATDAP